MSNPNLIMDIAFHDDVELVRQHILDHRNNVEIPEECNVDFRIRHKSGDIRWIGHVCQAVYGDNHEYLGRRASNRDITDRKRSEQELHETQVILQVAMDQSQAGIAIADAPDGKLRYVNDSGLRIRGGSRETLVNGVGVDEYVASWQILDLDGTLLMKDDAPLARAIMYGETNSREFIVRNSANDDRIIWANAAPVKDNRGKVTAGIVVFLDITDRKRLEDERLEMQRKLMRSQKLESLGLMAGGIAHDFNNLLAVVLGNLELALLDVPQGSVIRPSIEQAFKAAKRSAELSGQMLAYSGSAFYYPEDLDLNELVKKNTAMFTSSLPETTKLDIHVGKYLPFIQGSPDQIQRIIMNLVINASEAIKDKVGAVTLTTGVMDCDESYLGLSRIEEKPSPGGFVFLEVTDNGCGMELRTLERLFDPFFSTKFTGRGLGMAEVLGIVKGHDGAIIVESEVNKGTTIRILFPASRVKK
jgi:PAS domain S-box-containing protein